MADKVRLNQCDPDSCPVERRTGERECGDCVAYRSKPVFVERKFRFKYSANKKLEECVANLISVIYLNSRYFSYETNREIRFAIDMLLDQGDPENKEADVPSEPKALPNLGIGHVLGSKCKELQDRDAAIALLTQDRDRQKCAKEEYEKSLTLRKSLEERRLEQTECELQQSKAECHMYKTSYERLWYAINKIRVEEGCPEKH